ncbi:fungal pheromone STE3G-protein-coupled receptor [Mycena olivaceomarginata]|nr:fungal pheromone STE3G-protein-coupled receptor [Mycena olivaceomarginata]
MAHPELAVGAFLACVLVLIPLPWQWRARNTPVLSMMAWLFATNLSYAINAVIWYDNIDNVALVWCDIVTKLAVGSEAGLPACCLALVLRLWQVTSPNLGSRKFLMLDLSLCWGYPALTMILHYIVQGHRFNMRQDLGCAPTAYVSIPAIFIIYGPLVIIALLNFVFSGLAFSNFWRRRHSFAAALQRQKSSFTMRRYLRAMLATLVIAIWDTVVIILAVVLSFRDGLHPYTSWADVHSDFSRVWYTATLFIPATALTQMYFIWWTVPITAYLFFCLFAPCEDAVAEYRWVLRLVPRIRRGSKPDPSSSAPTSMGGEHHLSLPQRPTTAKATSAPPIDTVIDIKPGWKHSSTFPDSTTV